MARKTRKTNIISVFFIMYRIVPVIIMLCCVGTNSLAEASSEHNLDLESVYSNGNEQLRYQDIFSLTWVNFTRCVLQSYEPWVVLLHRGTLGADWKRTAVQLRGVVWFGMVDAEEETELLREMNFEVPSGDSAADSNIARVYPFGKRSIKEKKYHDVISPHAALSLAVQSLPTDSMTSLRESEELNEFLMDCLAWSPARFPVIFVVDYNEPFPPAFIALSIRLKRYFSFGRLDSSQTSMLEELDIGKLKLQPPAMVVIKSSVIDNKLKFVAIPYRAQRSSGDDSSNEDTSTDFSYPSLLQFLYSINSRYRQDLPGNNMAEDEEVITMEDVIDEEKKRFQITRVSGSPLLPKVGRKNAGVTIDVRQGPKIEL